MAVMPPRKKWKSAMTDRQRFVAQMHYQPFDRCFNREFGYWGECHQQWDLFVDNKITHEGEANAFFAFDTMGGIGGNVWMHPGFEYKVIRETETTRVIRDWSGLIAEVPKDGHSTIPHFTDSSIKTPADWKEVKAEKFRRDDPTRKVDAEAIKKSFPKDRDFPAFVDCGSMIGRIRDMLTVQGLAFAVYDYPDMVEDMVETACLLVEDFLDQVLPLVDWDAASGWEDISCNTGPLVSMDFYRSVIVPRYKRIGAKLHSHGIDLWWTDSDGDIRAMIPGFLESGLNIMFPFEVNGCKHPGAVLDKYGKNIRIMGGVDKMALRAGPRAIDEYLTSLVPYVKRGGFIPHVDHRCPPDVTPASYLYYLDLKEKLFGQL